MFYSYRILHTIKVTINILIECISACLQDVPLALLWFSLEKNVFDVKHRFIRSIVPAAVATKNQGLLQIWLTQYGSVVSVIVKRSIWVNDLPVNVDDKLLITIPRGLTI